MNLIQPYCSLVEPEDESTNALVLYFIMQVMDDDIFYIVENVNTTQEAWENLEIHYGVRRSHTQCKVQSKDIEENDAKIAKIENEEDGVEDKEIKEKLEDAIDKDEQGEAPTKDDDGLHPIEEEMEEVDETL